MDRSFGRARVRALAWLAGLAVAFGSAAAVAVPVRLDVHPGAGLRDLSASCEGGTCERPVAGALEADRRGRLLSGIHGTLELGDGERMVVVGGVIDFRRPFPDRAIGRLFTATHGDFSFVYDHAGPNAFDGGLLELLGATTPSRNRRAHAGFVLSLRARVRPALAAAKVPEPAWLASVGVLLAHGCRRRLTGGAKPA